MNFYFSIKSGSFILLALALGLWNFAAAQQAPLGQPFTRAFLPKDYRAELQNWAVAQDDNGFMYFGNGVGVLVYDGSSWQVVPTSNGAIVRSLSVSPQTGKVYVGGKGDFGYVSPNEAGEFEFQSLKSLLDSSALSFGDVWQIIPAKEGICFNAGRFVFIYNESSNSIKAIQAPEPGLHRAYGIDGEFFVIIKNGPLAKIQGDSLIAAGPGAEQFADKRLYALFSHRKGRALYGIANEGLFEGPLPTQISTSQPLELTPFTTGMENWMLQNFLYLGEALSNGNFVIGTLGGGAAEFTAEGKILRIFNQDGGLEANSVYALGESRDGSLWLALSKGIAQLEVKHPLSYWGKPQNMPEATASVHFFNGNLYAATFDQGLILQDGKFSSIQDFPGYCWEISDATNPSSNEKHLFVSGQDGIYEIKEDRAFPLVQIDDCNLIYWNEKAPEYLITGQVQGMSVTDWQGHTPRKMLDINDEVRRIAMDRKGNIWAATLYSGIYKVTPNDSWSEFEVTQYDTLRGLNSMKDNQVWQIGDEIWVSNIKSNLVVAGNELKPAIEASQYAAFAQAAEGHIIKLTEQSKKGEWVALINQIDNQNHRKAIYFDARGVKHIIDHPLRRINAQGDLTIKATGDSILWLGMEEGLYRLDTKKELDSTYQAQAIISRVYYNNDSLIYSGGLPNGQYRNVLTHDQNALLFEFGNTLYQQSEHIQYSYWLENHDEEWSSWTKKDSKEYTDLFEGNYTMKVKAKNTEGIETAIATYRFRVAPPWYRSWWAYLIYTALAIGLLVLVAKLNSIRHKAQNRRLEAIVIKRTAEISSQNEEIEQQREVLAMQNQSIVKKNKDLSDSVKAAQRILNALHTSSDALHEILPNSFVFAKPKDVVSGDFFWATEIEGKVLLAVVDCTGHGVPGAFMSVIGHTLLKDTVYLYEQHQKPSEVLKQLHYLVVDSLATENERSTEGMDMSLCIIDPAANQLHFAGARSSMIYIEDGALKTLKGDRLPIGGIRLEKERVFTDHTLALKPDSCFYLFSDGYQDQFGGKDGTEKLKSKRLREQLSSINALPMPEQGKQISDYFEDWKQHHPQTDDVMVIGFKAGQPLI